MVKTLPGQKVARIYLGGILSPGQKVAQSKGGHRFYPHNVGCLEDLMSLGSGVGYPGSSTPLH